MNGESHINIDDWNERVSSRCYYSCDLLHHQRHHHQLEPTAWLLRITTVMLSSTWFSYSSLQPTTTPTIKHLLLSFTNKGLQQQKSPFSSLTEGPVCPYSFLFFLHSIFFFHSLPIFIWFIISQKQPKEEGRWEKEQSHRLWLLVAGIQHSCHGVIYNDFKTFDILPWQHGTILTDDGGGFSV